MIKRKLGTRSGLITLYMFKRDIMKITACSNIEGIFHSVCSLNMHDCVCQHSFEIYCCLKRQVRVLIILDDAVQYVKSLVQLILC